MNLFGGRDTSLAFREAGFGRDEVRCCLECGLAGVCRYSIAVGLYMALKPVRSSIDRCLGRIAINMLLLIRTVDRAGPRLRRDINGVLERLLLYMPIILRHRDPNRRTASSRNHAAFATPTPRAIGLLLDRLPAVKYPGCLIAFPRVGADDGGA